MTQQVSAHHLNRLAYLYVRQSTLQQVLENTESTACQYALRERALALGWSQERIVVIDQDLGQSGASTTDRLGFQRLVAEQLNQQGFRTFEGLPFHCTHVYQLRRHHGLADRYARLRDRGMLTAEELASSYGVTVQTIWRWYRQGSIAGLRYNDRGSCLFLPKASQPLFTDPK